MSLRSAFARLPASKLYTVATSNANQTRFLSGQGNMALRKLQQAFEEYRMTNYSQETPLRFKKEIVSAAKDHNDEFIAPQGLERVLHNIGADKKVSRDDLKVIFDELGVSGFITADRMVSII